MVRLMVMKTDSMRANYSDYIVYVDESGDHGLKSIDPQYPIFSLAFCIFNKSDYIQTIAPALNALKCKYWGHCDVVLHEHDIRKGMADDWSLLNDKRIREAFLADITSFIQNTSFQIIAGVINKHDLAARYSKPSNPYELAMLFCMQRLNDWLTRHQQSGTVVQVHFEARGKNEDNDLRLEFRRICANAATAVGSSTTDFSKIAYRIRFLGKKANSTGLQLADLVARPIGLNVLRPNQRNRAFEVMKGKLITDNDDRHQGKGLKVFP